jgi:radical SAM superfamily enzyme YgiQ (UPF0313 family)
MNVLLISPRTPDTFWSFRHVLPLISKKAAFPPLGLLTVAAMLPREWNLRLVDLNVTRLSQTDIDWADAAFVSGMIVHEESARRAIAQCAAAGKTVIAGGPLFTTGHERFPDVRHFALGESEDYMPQLVDDLGRGRLKPFYHSAGRPDVEKSPIPRWDLLNFNDYATMPLQFSRGCPFDCEFCDVIVMNGRVPRAKSPAKMIAELESLIDAGWKGPVFIVDDNFIGNKARVKTLLRELIAWRRRRNYRTTFTTEASLNLADDAELLRLMGAAGFKRVFIGIESPEEDALIECSKVQNTRRDLVASVKTIHNAGIEVMGGFIVGFDSDRPGIFARQHQFIQSAGVVTAMVGLLTALPRTRLFNRLQAEGRLLTHSTGNNVDAVLNFIPRLDRDLLVNSYRQLVKRLYEPREYYQRIRAFLRDFRPADPRPPLRRQDALAFCRSLWIMGVATRGRREFWKFLLRTSLFHRCAFAEALQLVILGHHFRKVAEAL